MVPAALIGVQGAAGGRLGWPRRVASRAGGLVTARAAMVIARVWRPCGVGRTRHHIPRGSRPAFVLVAAGLLAADTRPVSGERLAHVLAALRQASTWRVAC